MNIEDIEEIIDRSLYIYTPIHFSFHEPFLLQPSSRIRKYWVSCDDSFYMQILLFDCITYSLRPFEHYLNGLNLGYVGA